MRWPSGTERAVLTVRRVAISVATVALLSSCGESTGEDAAIDPSTDPVDELAMHSGQFCPARLPRASQETYGFGTDERATSLPALPAFDEVWLCSYETQDIAPQGADGAWYEWVMTGSPEKLNSDQVDSLSAALDELSLIEDGDFACTAELGPRYLVSAAWERDLTGVVIDDYGCGSVRLTDDPFVTIPGDASQPGTVDGVLQAPDGLLAILGAGRDR